MSPRTSIGKTTDRLGVAAAGETAVTCVYLLRSVTCPAQTYVGPTDDVDRRLAVHNAGGSVHTARSRPWRLVTYTAFQDREQAARFESYLKTGSGRAFAKRHLW